MKPTIRLSAPLTSLCVAALLAATPTFAEIKTAPVDREAKALLVLERQATASMLPCEGTVPVPKADARKADCPASPCSSTFDSAGLSRFLEIGIKQSYNKTFQDGYNILSTVLNRSLNDLGMLPRPIQAALEAGREASYSKSWEVGYKILHTTLSTVARSPEQLLSDPRTSAGAFLALGRQCSYDRSFQDGYNILNAFTKKITGDCTDLLPSREFELIVRTGMKASYEKSWQAGYEILHAAVKRVDLVGSGDFKVTFLTTGLECSYNKSFQDGYNVLKTFINAALEAGFLSPFDRASLDTTLKASYNKTWQAGYEILRDGIKGLLSK